MSKIFSGLFFSQTGFILYLWDS